MSDDTEGTHQMHGQPAPEIPGKPLPSPGHPPAAPFPETPGDDPTPDPQAPPRHPDNPEDDNPPTPDTPEALAIRIP